MTAVLAITPVIPEITKKGILNAQKKIIAQSFRKAVNGLLTTVLVLSAAVLPLVVPEAETAKADVSIFNIMGGPPGMMIGPGMLFPALNINAAGDAGETLVSVTVDVLIPQGSSFDPTTGLAPLSATSNRAGITIYKDNKSAGNIGAPDQPEDFNDFHLPLSTAPQWQQAGAGVWEATLNLATPDALPSDDSGSNMGADYFIVVSTSDNPAPGSSFQVQIPADGVVMDMDSFPLEASPAIPNIFTIGQGGMMGSPVLISKLQTRGGADAPNDEFIELYNRTPNPVDLQPGRFRPRAPATPFRWDHRHKSWT